MKQLTIYQIKHDSFFLKENSDLLPDGFVWFYSILNDSIKKEDRFKYPSYSFMFNKDGKHILHYNRNTKYVLVNYDIWHVLTREGSLSHKEIQNLYIPMLKQYFNVKIKKFDWAFTGDSKILEDHFKNRC